MSCRKVSGYPDSEERDLLIRLQEMGKVLTNNSRDPMTVMFFGVAAMLVDIKNQLDHITDTQLLVLQQLTGQTAYMHIAETWFSPVYLTFKVCQLLTQILRLKDLKRL